MAVTHEAVGNPDSGAPSPSLDDLRARVASLHWWHHIDLGRGLVTPGITDKRHQEWVTSHLPTRLDGRSVLDIGAWDGYYGFLAEERGARRVLAIDKLQNPEAHAWATDAAVQHATATVMPRRSPVRSRIQPHSGLAAMYAIENAETTSA